MKKYLFALPALLFPYALLFGLHCLLSGFLMESVFRNNGYLLIFALFLYGVFAFVCTAALCAALVLKKTDACRVARLNLIVKFCQVPAYVLIFVLGALTFVSVWGIGFAVVFFLHDAASIFMSGLLGSAAVVRGRAEGKIPGRKAVLYAVGQFLFCIDLVACALLYVRVRGKRPEAEGE